MITLVTCWYNLKSKFNVDIYKKWIYNFINNVSNFNLIIFTNTESLYIIDNIIEINNNKHIKIIIKEFENFEMYKYKKQWIENHEKNNLLNHNSIHNTDWKLNMLWSEKIYFVKNAIEENYFDSDVYGWCDIGYFRGDNISNEVLKNWPNNDKIDNIKKEKIYYGMVCSKNTFINLHRYIINKNDMGLPMFPIPDNQISIAGGFFITNKKNIEWWSNTYDYMLEKYFKNKYLVKDDQIIILNCICDNLERFVLVEENNENKDRWFVFQSYLS